VRHGGEQLRKLLDLPVYAVGEATAAAARKAGFSIAAVGDAGVDRLLGRMRPDLSLLHLCGEDRATSSDVRHAITPIIVYRAMEIAAADIGTFSGIALIHSPRAGRRFAELVTERSGIRIAAISDAAAQAVGTGWSSVETADEANDEALLALAARLCNKPATP
jgi:uroporphyrinogen-III synthase